MCLSPLVLRTPTLVNGVSYIQVPCGHCIECLKEKQYSNSAKIYYELCNCGNKACFLTLTYRNVCVPTVVNKDTGEVALTLRKKDVQDWLKRFRMHMKRKYDIKNIRVSYCSEYGSRTFRPHYHVLVYGLSVSECSFAIIDWYNRHGLVNYQDVKFSNGDKACVSKYIGKYASKGVFSDSMPIFNPKESSCYNLIERPKFINSIRLGFDLFFKSLDYRLGFDKPILKFDNLVDYLDYYRNYWTLTVGSYVQRLPFQWRNFMFGKQSSKKYNYYGQHFINGILSKVPSLSYACESEKGFSIRNFRVAFENALFTLRDRFLVKSMRSIQPDLSETFDNCLTSTYRRFMEERFGKQSTFARRAETSLELFYSRSFC